MRTDDLVDDFNSAWRALVRENRAGLELWSALVRLTELGERPTPVERLAAALGRSADDTLALIQRWGSGVARVQDGLVYHDHPSAPGPATRWRIRVGERTIYSESGCAPDLFVAALWLGKPVGVETTCPATGTQIRVDLAPDGIARAEPVGAVVSVKNPRAPEVQQISNNLDSAQLDVDICSQQRVFVSVDAAAGWLAANPGGRVFPVGKLFGWMRDVGLDVGLLHS